MTISKLPLNLSPKLAYTILSLIVTWCITHYAISLDPEISGGISLVLASLVGYNADPGEVINPAAAGNDVASDDLLSAKDRAQAERAVPAQTPGPDGL